MSKDILTLATRYAGNSSAISDAQCALGVLPLVSDAVESMAEQVTADSTDELREALALIKRFLLARQHELRAESISIRSELRNLEVGNND
ncbi:hypothetical protein ND67_004231 [Salmonella enterica subsp. enterica serovar Cotham]|nr:hypothetical protein [Salmonella enterica]EDW0187365.1 hypothetical protein [Salmonella enterica subsp. enterica serovar Cotham]